MLAVPVVLGSSSSVASPLDVGALVLGVIGWSVALALRTPLPILIVRAVRGDRMRADPIIAVAGGVIAEVVRLGIVLVVTLTAPGALWVGLGWGAAEAVFAVVSGAAIVAMIGSDPEADQAISLLPCAIRRVRMRRCGACWSASG